MKKMNSGYKQILYAEDNPDDAELTLLTLKKNRLANEIIHVSDGAEALEYLFGDGCEKRRLPQLVLLDLKMPKVDGLEVLKRIRSDNRTKNLPVVILTSSNEDQDIVSSYELGVNSYIVKPVDFDQFSKAVKQLSLYWLLLNALPDNNKGEQKE
jgi:two-component system response regulator